MLQARLEADLAASWTPHAIAGRSRREAADPTVERMANSPDAQGRTVSAEAIYQYIYAMPAGSSHGGGSSCSPSAPSAGPAPPVGPGAV